MARTALITGAGGFLARHVATAFRDAGWRLVGIGRSNLDEAEALYDTFQLNDLSDATRILAILEKFAPSLIVHLAAPASVPASLVNPVADVEAHVMPAARLLDALRVTGSDTRFLLVSSAAVYGNPATLPVRETDALAPVSPYGFHKLQQELLCDEYLQVFGVRCVKARIFSTFGEGLRRLAVWDLTRRALAGDATVFGTGRETRDYLYAADVAGALLAIAERSEFDGRAINVGSGTGITIADLARSIFALVGAKGEPRLTGTAQPGMPPAWVADVSRLRELGWSSQFPLEKALATTVDWIRGHA